MRTGGAKGGDVIFEVGRGADGSSHGDFIFRVPTKNGQTREVLRICGNGAFVVDGKWVANDIGVYWAFREFIMASVAKKEKV